MKFGSRFIRRGREAIVFVVLLVSIFCPVGVLSQVEARLASAVVGPGGVMRAGTASLNLSMTAAGLIAGADTVRTFPGFPGELPNIPPNASNGIATRVVGSGIRFSTFTAVSRSTDADGDRLRVVWVERESVNGARIELDGDWITYLPPPDFDLGDSFEFVLADSYGDTDTARIRIRALPPPPDDPFRSRVDTDGRPLLRFRGTPGSVYRIQTSPGFAPPAPWETIAEAVADGTGLISYPVPVVPAEAVRYYRSVP